jgi:hypothetical protein
VHEQATLHSSWKLQDERMGSDWARLKRCERSSPGSLFTKLGPFAYWSAVAVIFGWAAWLRFRLPLDPIAVPDTWGYLSPALRKLIGAEFGHTRGLNFIYPGFVYLVLQVFGDFRAITVIQHLLGLLAGGVLLLTWQRIRDFIPSPYLPYPIHRCLGLLAAAVYMFSREPLCFEMDIRPESICGFLNSINLYFIIQFTASCFLEGRRTATVAYGIALVSSSILLASVKPSFGLTATIALLPVAGFFFRRGWFRQKIALTGGATVSAALLLLPEHFLSRNDEVSQTFLPTTLFVIHANLIRDQMADDLERNAKVPYPREWLERVHTALSTEIAKSFAAWPRHYATLGFDPDYLMYNQNSINAQLHKEFGNKISGLCTFYWFYYWQIWRQRPLLVAKKIMRQMAIFYAPKCPAYQLGKFLSLTDEYKISLTSLDIESYRKIWTAYPPAVDFMKRTQVLARRALVVPQSAYIRRPLGVLAVAYRPLLLIALALSAAVFLHKGTRRRLGWLAAFLVCFLYSANFGNVFGLSLVHTMEVPRYSTVQMFFTILAQFLTILLILEVLLGSRALIGRKSTQQAPRRI